MVTAVLTTLTTMITAMKALGIDAPFIFQSVVTFLVLGIAIFCVLGILFIWLVKKVKEIILDQTKANDERVDKLVKALESHSQKFGSVESDLNTLKKDMGDLKEDFHQLKEQLVSDMSGKARE